MGIDAEAEAVCEGAIRHAAAAEGAVSDKDASERRYGSGKGNLRPKQVVVDGRVNALDRAVVAVNIGEAAEPGANFVFAREFPTVGVECGRRFVVHEGVAAEHFDFICDSLSTSGSGESES